MDAPPRAKSPVAMETAADEDLCVHAFRVLVAGLNRTDDVPPLVRGGAGGLFVTFSKKPSASSSEYDLRGCIGNLSSLNVGRSLGYYAKQAAFHDPRFPAISSSELSALQVGVSLLHTFEERPKGKVYDWVVGTHGIVLNIQHNGRSYSATYLPEVMSEEGWTQKDAIESLSRKAGFRDPLTSDALENSSVTRYQSSQCKMSYQKFVQIDKQT